MNRSRVRVGVSRSRVRVGRRVECARAVVTCYGLYTNPTRPVYLSRALSVKEKSYAVLCAEACHRRGREAPRRLLPTAVPVAPPLVVAGEPLRDLGPQGFVRAAAIRVGTIDVAPCHITRGHLLLVGPGPAHV